MSYWNWLTNNALHYHLLFIEGLTAEQAAGVFGEDCTQLAAMDRQAATHLALTQRELAPLRFATVGSWLICLEEHSQLGSDLGLLHRISHGHEVIAVSSNANAFGSFTYLADGSTVVQFEEVAPHRRSGGDPDRLLAAMHEIGTLDPAAGHDTSPREAALELASRLSGVRLDEQTATQELPTAVCRRLPVVPPTQPSLSTREGLGRPLGTLVPASVPVPVPQSGGRVLSSDSEPER